MSEVFVNLDARFLAELAAEFPSITPDYATKGMRLLQIARNLQKMDDRSSSAYSRGFQDGRASSQARSNLSPSSTPANLSEALALWKGEVTKLPPDVKVEHKETLTADDLEFD